MSILSERLRELRAEKNLTQTAAAEEIGIKRTTYHTYESGANVPPASTLQKLADFYNVTVDYLLGNDLKENEEIQGLKKTYVICDGKTNKIIAICTENTIKTYGNYRVFTNQ